VKDLGAPGSYLTLESGTPVFAQDGSRLGAVEHVLADEDADVFDGLVLDASVLPGGHRFVDASMVDEIFERGVVLDLDAAEAKGLPEPSANPAVMEASPDDAEESDLERKLRRAWDRISGNY
jgi:uncharacterized protein YrrD